MGGKWWAKKLRAQLVISMYQRAIIIYAFYLCVLKVTVEAENAKLASFHWHWFDGHLKINKLPSFKRVLQRVLESNLGVCGITINELTTMRVWGKRGVRLKLPQKIRKQIYFKTHLCKEFLTDHSCIIF